MAPRFRNLHFLIITTVYYVYELTESHSPLYYFNTLVMHVRTFLCSSLSSYKITNVMLHNNYIVNQIASYLLYSYFSLSVYFILYGGKYLSVDNSAVFIAVKIIINLMLICIIFIYSNECSISVN